MRAELPTTRPNGHLSPPPQVYVLSGICQDPHFRLPGGVADFCLIYLGAPALGVLGESSAVAESAADEPYFLWRRAYENGAALVALRVDWEGIFTLLANDDQYAEAVFQEIVEPGRPEDVVRRWSTEDEVLQLFSEWLTQA